jgi:superoxide dismutase, Fe-Mn family
MALTLMQLPWAQDALAPKISAETIEYHYGKHHKGYLDKVNAAIEGTPLAGKSLPEIVKAAHQSDKGLFNNAAQVWNHDLYWNSISPDGGGEPPGAIATALDKSFGGFAAFKQKFSDAAATQFGSGWAWVVKSGDGLAIETTSNADTPLAHGKNAILTLDVWEHAYYIDYRNARPKYIEQFWSLINWNQIASAL